MFNKKAILDFLDKATDMIKVAAPLATVFGIPFVEKIAGIADTAVDVAKDTLKQAEETKDVLTSEEKEFVQTKLEQLSMEADRLNEIIVNS